MFNFPCTSRIVSSIFLRWDGRRKENDGEIEPEKKSGEALNEVNNNARKECVTGCTQNVNTLRKGKRLNATLLLYPYLPTIQ